VQTSCRQRALKAQPNRRSPVAERSCERRPSCGECTVRLPQCRSGHCFRTACSSMA
jgi:hypothetical protein